MISEANSEHIGVVGGGVGKGMGGEGEGER